jgi:pyruvate,orthophosphate dikinase
MLRIMAGKDVCVRLLDAPVHEFMPRTGEELESYAAHLRASGKSSPSITELQARIDALRETNPMLGRRGCRFALSCPELYPMQARALFEAAQTLRKEGIESRLEIMVPLVMNPREFRIVAWGKKIEGDRFPGIADTEEAVRREQNAAPIPCKIGAMIELPAAALDAADIAAYAAFFSFGANDLTQTALGLSRDDYTTFMSPYTRYDLLEGDPFGTLDCRVQELIALAVDRGRLTRPDLACGFCGEQGADPAAIRFCIDTGIDYVSCSPYSIPGAILAAAQLATKFPAQLATKFPAQVQAEKK